jgi:hypothetical protein
MESPYKAEIRAHLKAAAGRIAIDSQESLRFFPMRDPTIAVTELAIKGRAVAAQPQLNRGARSTPLLGDEEGSSDAHCAHPMRCRAQSLLPEGSRR